MVAVRCGERGFVDDTTRSRSQALPLPETLVGRPSGSSYDQDHRPVGGELMMMTLAMMLMMAMMMLLI